MPGASAARLYLRALVLYTISATTTASAVVLVEHVTSFVMLISLEFDVDETEMSISLGRLRM